MSGRRKADDAVRFFARRLTHTKGSFARQPFILAPWQERIVRDICGTLKRHGFRRIGIGRNFVHVDNDASLPNPTIWLY